MNAPDIRKAIETLGAALAADPAKARAKNAPATARLTEGLQFEVTGPHGARIVTDMPPAMGGAASGPNPGWYLRASLAACTSTVIAMRAAKLGIRLELLELTVESESDQRGLLGLDPSVSAAMNPLRTRVRIRGDAPPEALRELAAWSDAHSPVGCTLRQLSLSSLEFEVV
jgi:uncharacterized OsmC-like protein